MAAATTVNDLINLEDLVYMDECDWVPADTGIPSPPVTEDQLRQFLPIKPSRKRVRALFEFPDSVAVYDMIDLTSEHPTVLTYVDLSRD